MFYLIEVRDSDGNDCTVYDAIVRADTREQASHRLWEHLSEMYPDDETDGGFGTFHACDCECEHGRTARGRSRRNGNDGVCDECRDAWECEHGGLLTDEDTPNGCLEFASEDYARLAHAPYHSLIDLTD